MSIFKRYFFLLVSIIIPFQSWAVLLIGVGKSDITPPIGTPSAGYADRRGEGMEGVHDPLLAVALFIDTGEKKIAFCSVDHLGFTYEMAQQIAQQIHALPQLTDCEVYISSSHTHSGSGAYLSIPKFGETLAGSYSSELTLATIAKTVNAIVQASQNAIPAKIGVGITKVEGLSQYRGSWPVNVEPLKDVAIIKVVKEDETPLAVLFNYPVHPTILKSQNRLFSADFVGYARNHLQKELGGEVQPLFINGAQGDIAPTILNETDRFIACEKLGTALAESVAKVWEEIKTTAALSIQTEKFSYAFEPKATPGGLQLPLKRYESEINLIVFNQEHAFLTIPGELSCIYDKLLKRVGKQLGYSHVSIFGLTNDAHGYIITPEAWSHKTMESNLSFGGENYGELVFYRTAALLQNLAPAPLMSK